MLLRSPRLSLSLVAACLIAIACAEPHDPSGSAEGADAPSATVADPQSAERRTVLRSDVFTIESRFSSMHGPAQRYAVELEGVGDDDLVWLRSVTNQAVDAEDGTALSDELLCHSNLAIDPDQGLPQPRLAVGTPGSDPRLFTLIQGRNDVTLPAGFGLPIDGSSPLQFDTMVINKSSLPLPIDLRVETVVDYLVDDEIEQRPRPLFKRRIFTFLEVRPDMAMEPDGHDHHEAEGHQSGAAQKDGSSAMVEMASAVIGKDSSGREYTFHWMVEPGHHEYVSDATGQLALPFETTLHYATAHLHPYGQAIRIVDRASGEVVLELAARQYQDREGIAEMEEYSDPEGIVFHAGRAYDLVTVYDNPTAEPIDAMAIVYLYFEDRAFEVESTAG